MESTPYRYQKAAAGRGTRGILVVTLIVEHSGRIRTRYHVTAIYFVSAFVAPNLVDVFLSRLDFRGCGGRELVVAVGDAGETACPKLPP